MNIKKIDGFGNYGSFVEDVDLENISDDEFKVILEDHGKNLLTIIRLEKKINYEKYYDLILKFGESNYNFFFKSTINSNLSYNEIFEINKISQKFLVDKKYETLQRVTAIRDEEGNSLGVFGDGELLWHSNGAGDIAFIPGVALMGCQSMQNTATSFVQTADYFENLSESFKSELMEMVVVHNYQRSKINPEPIREQELIYKLGMCIQEDSKIPLVIKSPSGVIGLHLGLNTFDYIEGMKKEESDKLIDSIKKEIFTEKYIYDYWWENDQNIVIFDNSITLHRRILKSNSCGERMAYRIPFGYQNLYGEYLPYFNEHYNNLRCEYYTQT